MEEIWKTLELNLLKTVSVQRGLGAAVPDHVKVYAFGINDRLTGMWYPGSRLCWDREDPPRSLLMVLQEPWEMRFAVREALPCSYPGKPDTFLLGLNASVGLKPGPGGCMKTLLENAGSPDALKRRDVYPVFQDKMEDIWRREALAFCGGCAWSRGYWQSRLEDLTARVRTEVQALLLDQGFLLTGGLRIRGISPVAVRRPDAV